MQIVSSSAHEPLQRRKAIFAAGAASVAGSCLLWYLEQDTISHSISRVTYETGSILGFPSAELWWSRRLPNGCFLASAAGFPPWVVVLESLILPSLRFLVAVLTYLIIRYIFAIAISARTRKWNSRRIFFLSAGCAAYCISPMIEAQVATWWGQHSLHLATIVYFFVISFSAAIYLVTVNCAFATSELIVFESTSCVHCGYSLCGSAAQGRCPECGTPSFKEP